ncbi:hypothetical protein Cde04nite_15400 [Cellulomonas denverensis]|nr:hypothetical protein Cde04nite_15400 [Cellulomonas denverensis]
MVIAVTLASEDTGGDRAGAAVPGPGTSRGTTGPGDEPMVPRRSFPGSGSAPRERASPGGRPLARVRQRAPGA